MRRKVATVYKQFEHIVELTGKGSGKEGKCKFLDFQASVQVIGKDRVLIYGSYNLLHYTEDCISAESVAIVQRPFQEMVDLCELEHIGVDWETCDIQVEILSEPEITAGKDGVSQTIHNSLPLVRERHPLIVRGQLLCSFFERSYSEEDIGGHDVICIASTRTTSGSVLTT